MHDYGGEQCYNSYGGYTRENLKSSVHLPLLFTAVTTSYNMQLCNLQKTGLHPYSDRKQRKEEEEERGKKKVDTW